MSTSRQTGRNRKSTTPATAPATPAAASTPASESKSWVHDYDYVMKDLRKLTIVSLSLFAIIIISGFFF